mgnify:CR=1 FL=1
MMNDERLTKVALDLKPDVEQVWDVIGNDVLAVDCGRLSDFPNKEAVECCVDADRLQLLIGDEAQEKLRRAVNAFGYSRVLEELARRVPLV